MPVLSRFCSGPSHLSFKPVHQLPKHFRCAAATGSTPKAPVDEDLSSLESVEWDPKNLLQGKRLPKGHIEKRLAERRATANANHPKNMILRVPEDAPDGLTFDQIQETFNGRSYADHVDVTYMRFAEEFHSQTKVLCLDPPVLVIDNFLSKDLCSSIIQSTSKSGLLERSLVGGGNVKDEGLPVSQTRTSSSLLISPDVQTAQPELKGLAEQVQSRIEALFPSCSWGTPGALPRVGQFTFEGLQVASYDAGQYFRSHEDAFPHELAAKNGFQRRATVLLYLNDVPEGGRTSFDFLDVSVEPTEGRALVFFPAFRAGHPDDRTRHSADDAVSEKWVCQQWCAVGVGKPAAKTPVEKLVPSARKDSLINSLGSGGSAATAQAGAGPDLLDAERMAKAAKHKKRERRKKKGPSKGFGP